MACLKPVLQQSDIVPLALPQVQLNATRKDLLRYFENGWQLTELLFSGLASDEAFYRRPYHQLRHPLIFYYGHVVSVYINKLRVAGLLDTALHADFEKLFEVGVDEMRWDDLHEGEHHLWPSVADVRAYRAEAFALIRNLIETHPALDTPITQQSPMWALVMGFEHERIHLETSSVLMRELPIELVQRPEGWPDHYPLSDVPAAANRMIPREASTMMIGKPHDFPTFGWDNEYGSDTREVRPFEASAQLISNGEFLEFVRAGGYAEETYWSRDGLAWRRFRNVKWPAFWVQNGPAGSHQFKLRTVFEIIPMQLSWPAIVNFHEAKAYCAWRSEQEGGMPYRLLTEAEHHALRDNGNNAANMNLTYGAESAVDGLAPNSKGYHDVFGNVWQWCEDHFHPLPGFKPHAYYDDFSTPCFDGEHQMILGGSFIATGDEAGPFARFHFRPHFHQHAGFRIVRSLDGNPASDAKRITAGGNATYETEGMLNQYMLMHWGSEDEIWGGAPAIKQTRPDVVHLPNACAELAVRFATEKTRALDIGCAVGGSAFALARDFGEVVGIDYSHEFVEAARTLQKQGVRDYWRKDSGGTGASLRAVVDPAIDRSRLRFEQGDACALPLHLRGFDAVVMSNVLCRLQNPAACLERMQGANALVKQGGVLVMTTPFSWREEYTPRDAWLKDIDAVAEQLSAFTLVHEEEMPFLLRDHARRFEYIITLASVWKRKS